MAAVPVNSVSSTEVQNAVHRRLMLMESLARCQRAVGVSELAHMAGISRSATHRALGDLVKIKYAQQDEDGKYLISDKLWKLGVLALESSKLRLNADKHMRELSNLTHRTVCLTALDDAHAVCVHRIDGVQAVASADQVGSRGDILGFPGGLAMLAFSLRSVQERVIGHLGSTEQSEVKSRWQDIHSAGFLVQRSRTFHREKFISVPVFGEDAASAGSLVLYFQEDRLAPEALDGVLQPALEAARCISASLKGTGVSAYSFNSLALWGANLSWHSSAQESLGAP